MLLLECWYKTMLLLHSYGICWFFAVKNSWFIFADICTYFCLLLLCSWYTTGNIHTNIHCNQIIIMDIEFMGNWQNAQFSWREKLWFYILLQNISLQGPKNMIKAPRVKIVSFLIATNVLFLWQNSCVMEAQGHFFWLDGIKPFIKSNDPKMYRPK